MRNHTVATILTALVVVSAGFCYAQQTPPSLHPAPSTLKPPSVNLMQEILAAWSTMDPANAAPYYDQSSNNVFFDILPMKYSGFANYAKGAADVLAGFRSLTFTLGNDAQVHLHGSLAWATATWGLTGTLKTGNKAAMDGRWTVVWEKKGDRWLIVHEHVSVPSPPLPSGDVNTGKPGM
ncbi:MAG TPA: nuclear transport factor 2 family protein [Terriglobales bacterium]|nr:nuclear transport factor 2 family protein [Terriglobales bacterium]